MADQRVNISIGSSYNGEGMTRALKGIDTLSKTTGKVAGAVGRLGSSFEALGGTAGKAIGNVSNLIGALATGGLWGGIIAGITTSISLFQSAFDMMDEMKRKTEEQAKAQKAAEESAKKWLQALKEKEMNDIISNGEKYVATLNKLAAAENRVTAAQNKLNASMDAVQFASLNQEIAQSVNAASSPDEKARARAAGNIRLAEAQQSNIATRTQEEVDYRRKALADAKAVELHTRATLEAAEWGGGKADQAPLHQAIAARKTAELELAAAEQKQKEAAIKAQTDVDNAKAAQKELIDAQNEAAKKLREEAEQAERRKELEQEIVIAQTHGTEEMKRLDGEINDAKEDLKAAIKRAQAAYNAANPDLEKLYNSTNDEALRRRMSSSTEWGTGREFNAGKAARWAATHGDKLGGLSQKEQREYDRLAGKAASNPLGMQDSEWRKLHELAEKDPERKAQKAQEAADKEAERLAQLQQQKEAADKQMRQNIQDIKTKIDELTTK